MVRHQQRQLLCVMQQGDARAACWARGGRLVRRRHGIRRLVIIIVMLSVKPLEVGMLPVSVAAVVATSAL